jgi:hypothetical protein
MYGVQIKTGLPFLRRVLLAPHGLYASPGWIDHLDDSTIIELVSSLREIWTRSFTWNVRFDQAPLADALHRLGLESQRKPCLIVPLHRDYERVFSGYSATIRNEVRKARRLGVLVRDATTTEDIQAYYEVYMRLVDLKRLQGGWRTVYPIEFFLDLAKLRGTVRLLLAEYENATVACGMFARDGCSVFHFHGASDRNGSFAVRAVIDEAIHWACDIGAVFFNLADSAGIASLEQFKAKWGAHREFNWTFEWQNPIWKPLSHLSTVKRSTWNAVRSLGHRDRRE